MLLWATKPKRCCQLGSVRGISLSLIAPGEAFENAPSKGFLQPLKMPPSTKEKRGEKTTLLQLVKERFPQFSFAKKISVHAILTCKSASDARLYHATITAGCDLGQPQQTHRCSRCHKPDIFQFLLGHTLRMLHILNILYKLLLGKKNRPKRDD